MFIATMKNLSNTLLLTLFFLWSGFGSAQHLGQQSLAQLEESPAGKYVIAFIQLINEGKEVSATDIPRLFSPSIIERNTAENLINIVLDIRESDGQLELYEADRVEKFQYNLLLKGLNHEEFLAMELNMAEKEPYKIEGLRLVNSAKKPKNAEPLLSPQTKMTFEARPVNYLEHQELIKEADKIAQTYVDMNWFSGVVMLAKNGQPFYEKAYGYADIEKKIPNTPETKFRIGSINKSFTATLITQMVEEGKLSYDDKLSKFNLGFSAEIGDKVQLKHILTHTAGFADIFIPQYLNNIRDYKDIDDIMPLLMNEPLIYEPGKDEQYSNYGYIVLGAILEKISGKKFGDLLQENILDKIGLKDTHYDIAEHITGEAQSYRFTLSREKVNHTAQLEYCTPDGGMYSTAADLLNYYYNYLYTERLVSHKSKAIRVFGYNNPKKSWEDILKMGGGIGDAGGGPGVSALVEIIMKDEYMIIVLANTDNQIAEEVGLKIASALQGRSYPEPKLPPAFFAYQLTQKFDTQTLANSFKKRMKKEGYRDVNSGILNRIGYMLMREKELDEAIRIFKLNIDLFPKEANPYDSLGEAYFKQGNMAMAKSYYQKALKIDPNLVSAQEMLRKID